MLQRFVKLWPGALLRAVPGENVGVGQGPAEDVERGADGDVDGAAAGAADELEVGQRPRAAGVRHVFLPRPVGRRGPNVLRHILRQQHRAVHAGHTRCVLAPLPHPLQQLLLPRAHNGQGHSRAQHRLDARGGHGGEARRHKPLRYR